MPKPRISLKGDSIVHTPAELGEPVRKRDWKVSTSADFVDFETCQVLRFFCGLLDGQQPRTHASDVVAVIFGAVSLSVSSGAAASAARLSLVAVH